MVPFLDRLSRFSLRMLQRFFPGRGESLLFEIDLEQRRPVTGPFIQGEFRLVCQEELSDLEEQLPLQLLSFFRERFSMRKDLMIGYFVSDSLVYWGWVSFNEAYFEPDLNSWIKIPANAGYIYDTQTVPAFQRNGIHTAGILHLLELIKERGKEKATILIRRDNRNAIKAIRHFNPRCLGTLRKHE